MRHRSSPFAIVVLALFGTLAPLPAQIDRYELGLRLRRFERQLATAEIGSKRTEALHELEAAVQAFFGLDGDGVAAAVARAEWALEGTKPDREQRWAAALLLRCDARLVDRESELQATLTAMPGVLRPARGRRDDDDTDDGASSRDELLAPPAATTIELAIVEQPEVPSLRTAVTSLPTTLAMPLQKAAPGDCTLRWTIRRGDTVLLVREQGLSIATERDARLARLAEGASDDDDGDPATAMERATLLQLHKQLVAMTRPRGDETVMPGARLLAEAEAIGTAKPGEPYYTAARPGQFWLRVPTADGTFSIRLLVPAAVAAAPDRKVPLVVALHGAGGSENLFFDSYGDGEIVRQCERRGWLLAAPRSQGLTGVDVQALVTALAQRFPVDRRAVFLVGHSMGAMQAVANAMRTPECFCAVAPISGGGGVRRSEALKKLPFFVAAGSRDFGLGGSRALGNQLADAGVDATFRAYDDVEHLAAVQVALPDVFAFFDQKLPR